jgi:hypothetical protein
MRPVIAPVASVLDDLDALVPPAFWHCPEYAETLGPEVGDLNRLFGYGPNPEQQILLDGAFGLDSTGRFTAFEILVIASRQNLKTGFMIQKANGKALLLRRPLQVWTAHKESATDQAFAEFKKMAERSDEFSRRIKRMPEGKGSKEVEFINGCRIVFRPRTGKAGQSMSADDVDLDEYFAAEPKHEGSLIPTLSTRPNAQVGEASSAPHEGSELQRQGMHRGRLAALGMAEEPRLLYSEWSPMRLSGTTLSGKPKFAPPPCRTKRCDHQPGAEGCIADDREIIKLSNPSVGRSKAPSISWNYVADERRKLQGDALPEYIRERLSIGVEASDAEAMTIFGPAEVWSSSSTDRVPDGVGGLGVAMTADRSWIGIVGASMVEMEHPNDPEAEPIERMVVAPLLHTTDVAEALAEIKRVQDIYDCAVIYDERGPFSSLEEDGIDEADIATEPATLTEYATASARFYDLVVKHRTLLHLENDELDDQVRLADWRWVSDNRIIGRRAGHESVDTTLIEAAIFAVRAAAMAGTFNIN